MSVVLCFVLLSITCLRSLARGPFGGGQWGGRAPSVRDQIRVNMGHGPSQGGGDYIPPTWGSGERGNENWQPKGHASVRSVLSVTPPELEASGHGTHAAGEKQGKQTPSVAGGDSLGGIYSCMQTASCRREDIAKASSSFPPGTPGAGLYVVNKLLAYTPFSGAENELMGVLKDNEALAASRDADGHGKFQELEFRALQKGKTTRGSSAQSAGSLV